LGVLLCLALLAPAARAQEQPREPADGITVIGQGQAKGKPTVVEISAQVSGEAELTADAIVKYRDARKRAVDAIEQMKLPGLTIESEGFSVNQAVDEAARQAMMRGMPAPSSKQKVSVTEKLRLTLVDADKMESEALMDAVLKLIDTGRDSGLMIGPGNVMVNYYPPPPAPPLVSFKIPDPDELRSAAYKDAMATARHTAERLAELAGAKLGKIRSVSDMSGGQTAQGPVWYGYQPPQPQTLDELVAGVFGPISMNVRLLVKFELEPQPQSAARQ
jgi:uncharacterized protein YggE